MFRFVVPIMLAAALSPQAQAQGKKRVAVLNFDYATVQSDVRAIFGGNQDVGKGIADLLVNRLVSSGVYSVIERKALDKILACLLYTSPSPRDRTRSRMPSSA